MEFTVGKKVEINGITWDVLAEVEGGYLCITSEILCEKEFDEDNCNNWKESSLRAYLNGEFLEKLEDLKPIAYEQDLTTDDGLKEYGSSVDRVFLLTADQYRAYRQHISKVDNWWWLITADSTTNHNARIINTDGSLNYDYAYNGNTGVRPACVFHLPSEQEEHEKELKDAMKKQEPKVPDCVTVLNDGVNTQIVQCECGSRSLMNNDKKECYCWNCGQKMKWEE